MRSVLAVLAAVAMTLVAGVAGAAADGECGVPFHGDICPGVVPPPTQPVSALGFRSTFTFSYWLNESTMCGTWLPVAGDPPRRLSSLSGCVVDYSTGPVPGAVVVLVPAGGRGNVQWTRVDAFADFAFTDIDVSQGPYDLFVWAPGHHWFFAYNDRFASGSYELTVFLDRADVAVDETPGPPPCGTECGPPLSGVPLDGQVPTHG